MKVLHICTNDSGGAGIAVHRLHLGLKLINVSSKMLILHPTFPSNDIVQFREKNNSIKRIWNKMRNELISLEFKVYKKNRSPGLDTFSDDRSIYDISKHPLVKEATVIHLHWIACMVDYREFFSATMDKPIIWTLHDMNPFTGGCHVAGECTKYETGCGACPQLGSSNLRDLSRRIFKRKEKTYERRNIHFVAPSDWLAGCAKKSSLLKSFKIDIIPHGIQNSVFTKRDRKFSRDLLNLPQDKTLILFGAVYKTENKGFGYLMQALRQLKNNTKTRNIALVTFGPIQDIDNSLEEMGYDIYQLGYVDNENFLSHIYSAVDIFVIPSIQEAFGLVCLESMACGTPVVGFAVGGIPKMIYPYKTGFLVEPKNTEGLYRSIEYMIDHPQEREEMGRNARKIVEQEYTLEMQAQRYCKLYESILKVA